MEKLKTLTTFLRNSDTLIYVYCESFFVIFFSAYILFNTCSNLFITIHYYLIGIQYTFNDFDVFFFI